MSLEPVDWPTDDLLRHRAAVTPERTAVVDADRDDTWTYRQFDRRVDRLAAALAERGVGADDALGLLLDTRVAFVELIHAAMRRRATLVPVNTALETDELSAQVDQVGLDCLLCGADAEARAVTIAGGAPVYSFDEPELDGVDVLELDGVDDSDRDGEDDFEQDGDDEFEQDGADALERACDRRLDRPTGATDDVPPVERDWTQVVMFTSGTTGEPKGVRLTAGNLVASATASAFRLGVSPGDRWLACLPMYHMGGLAPVIRSSLYGTAVVVQREFDAEATRRVIDEHGVTGVSLVPTMLTRMLDAGWAPPEHLRFVLLGGAPASEELIDRCEARGVPVYPTYGSTETASGIATATPDQAFEHEGTVGQPLLFTDVTVVGLDDDGADGERLDAGEPGELVVDGPTVTPGYLDDEQTDAAFGPHGLHTGDVGYRDGDGRLWVVGRADDTIVTGGENVHPERVVDAIREHPAVEDAAVVGIPDPEWGERVGALVVGALDGDDPAGDDEDVDGDDLNVDDLDGEVLDVDGLSGHCRERLAGFEVPKTWGFADELPRTASGTVDREAVRERLDDG